MGGSDRLFVISSRLTVNECPLLAESSRWLTSVNGDFGPGTGRSDDIFRG